MKSFTKAFWFVSALAWNFVSSANSFGAIPGTKPSIEPGNKPVQFDIPEQTADLALTAFGQQADITVLFRHDVVKGFSTPKLSGVFTARRAIKLLLKDINLHADFDPSGVLIVKEHDQSLRGSNMQQKHKKKSLPSALALILASNFAAAQGGPDTANSQAGGVEEVVVLGSYRDSLRKSVDIKQNASNLVDVITATDIGRFPDENVAESLQRISGVQIQRLRGEGSQVSIRALPTEFTRTELNGRPLASAFNLGGVTRSFDFATLPSEFVGSLEVHKSPSAALSEGGLSGTVTVNTLSPLDLGKRTVMLSAQAAQNSNSGKTTPRLAGVYSDLFNDGAVGLTLGFAYTDRDAETQSAIGRGFRRTRNGAQNIVIYDLFDESRERTSFLGVLEFQPSDDLNIKLDGIHSDLTIDAKRFGGEFQFGNAIRNGAQEIPELTQRENFGGDALAVQLGIEDAEVRAASRREIREGSTTGFALATEYTPGDWTINAEASYSESDQTFDNTNVATQAILPSGAYDATLDNQVIGVNLSDQSQAYILDPNNYRILSFNGPWGSTNEDEITQVKLDFVSADLPFDVESNIKFGVSYTDRSQLGISQRIVIGATDFQNLTGIGDTNAFGDPVPGAADYLEPFSTGSGGYLGQYDGSANVPSFLVSNTPLFHSQFSRAEIEAAGNITQNDTATVDVAEESLSAYIQLDFASSDGAISGDVGVRVVDTDQTSRGISPDLAQIISFPDSGGIIEIPGAEPISVSRSYTNYLPSANLKMKLTDELLMRFSSSRTMSRPPLSRLSPSTIASSVPPTISSNNPWLDPFLSDNFDIATEWYFDDESLLSATFFYKDLVSLVRTTSEQVDLDIISEDGNGVQSPATEQFDINSVENGSGANVRGVELSYQTTFSQFSGFWENLGMQLNYTYIDNSEPESITGASQDNVNFVGFYETDVFSARLSYTWRSDYLLNPNFQENDGRFVESSGVLDSNLTYNLTDNLSVVLEAINLLDTPTNMIDGNDFPAVYEESGRRVLVGARYRF